MTMKFQYATITILAATTILLSCQLGLTTGLQSNSVASFPSRRRLPFQRPTTTWQWSAAFDDEPDLLLSDEDDEAAEVIDYDWDEQFEELKSFQAEYGHCKFPQNPPSELRTKYPTLASFCQHQRAEHYRYWQTTNLEYCSGKKMTLSSFDRRVRFQLLKRIGFEFDSQKVGWQDKYHELVEYRKLNGNLRVSRKENLSLYNWVNDQRKKRRGTARSAVLSETQITLLDDIGFQWESEFLEEAWNAKYKELVDFRKTHGHLDVEMRGPLYFWMDNQRRKRANCKLRAPLSDEQIRMLDGIEFPWIPKNQNELMWQAQYNELARFQKRHGHCTPSRPTYRSLEHWSTTQRKKRENGLLTKDRIELLDKIDFPWEHNRKEWPERCIELTEYQNEKGHLRVSEEENPELYEWMDTQRKRYHGIEMPKLADMQIELLEEISFSWSMDRNERLWHVMYIEAVEFFKEHGHVRVVTKDNPSLHNWIESQGKRYKELKGHKPLSEGELELLEQVDFAFFDNQPRMTWNAMYEGLVKYQKENNGQFPTRHKDDPNLNCWMRHQRNRMRIAYGYVPLSKEQRSLLESIGCPMLHQAAILRAWYEKYDQLVDFKQQHGHFMVDKKENPSLSKWIIKKREQYWGRSLLKRRPLTKMQIYLMERIGFPWISDRNDVEWQMRYDELVQFWKDHGHARVTEKVSESLHNWVRNQRRKYRGKGSSELNENQINQLEKIGFRWSEND